MLRFVGNGDQKKFTKNPRHFSMQNSQADTEKIFTKCCWRADKVNSESCSENTLEVSESSENGVFAPRAFFFSLKLVWSPGSWSVGRQRVHISLSYQRQQHGYSKQVRLWSLLVMDEYLEQRPLPELTNVRHGETTIKIEFSFLGGKSGGGKTGSICHLAFSLVLQCLGVPSYPDTWKNSTKSVIVTPLFLRPNMVVKTGT